MVSRRRMIVETLVILVVFTGGILSLLTSQDVIYPPTQKDAWLYSGSQIHYRGKIGDYTAYFNYTIVTFNSTYCEIDFMVRFRERWFYQWWTRIDNWTITFDNESLFCMGLWQLQCDPGGLHGPMANPFTGEIDTIERQEGPQIDRLSRRLTVVTEIRWGPENEYYLISTFDQKTGIAIALDFHYPVEYTSWHLEVFLQDASIYLGLNVEQEQTLFFMGWGMIGIGCLFIGLWWVYSICRDRQELAGVAIILGWVLFLIGDFTILYLYEIGFFGPRVAWTGSGYVLLVFPELLYTQFFFLGFILLFLGVLLMVVGLVSNKRRQVKREVTEKEAN